MYNKGETQRERERDLQLTNNNAKTKNVKDCKKRFYRTTPLIRVFDFLEDEIVNGRNHCFSHKETKEEY